MTDARKPPGEVWVVLPEADLMLDSAWISEYRAKVRVEGLRNNWPPKDWTVHRYVLAEDKDAAHS